MLWSNLEYNTQPPTSYNHPESPKLKTFSKLSAVNQAASRETAMKSARETGGQMH